MIKSLYVAMAALAGMSALHAAAPPAPHGATPTTQQVNWLRMEWYAFVHFGINTYTNREWGYGDENPKLFNPSDFDADAIVSTFKKAGMRGMIYTAKHHDGFCLWPTASTSHNITRAPWKDGKGDVAREFAEACAKHDIKFGTYLSPWDRNNAEYGRPGYLDVYYAQIKELLTQYGPIFEIWFDGANGGDGYYGGAKERRNIGKSEVYYNFPEVVRMIREIQPNCIIWGAEKHGDVMWGGSEKGFVKYPCWNVINRDKPDEKWISLEADTTINRAGWFWHPNSADRVKPADQLMQIYLESVGRGANLILNLAPDRKGRLDPADVDSLLRFGAMRKLLLAKDYALNAKVKASQVRGDDPTYSGSKVTDGDIETYWCPEDGTKTGELELTLPKPVTFDVVRIREQIRLGQRVTGFQIDVKLGNEWKTVDANGQTIGNQVLRKLAEPVTTNKIRVRITGSRACPCISEISLLKMPDAKMVDKVYGKSQAVRDSVVVKPLSRKNWKSSTPGAQAALDGKPNTHWLAPDAATPLEVDMGQEESVRGFSYLPRQDGNVVDMTDRYRFEISTDGKKWTKVAEGEFSNIRANPIELRVFFEQPAKMRYFRFYGERAIEGKGASAAEIKLFRIEKKSR